MFGALVPEDQHGKELIAFSVMYILLGLYFVLKDRKRVPALVHDGLRAPYAELAAKE
jgi:hypothetical protein